MGCTLSWRELHVHRAVTASGSALWHTWQEEVGGSFRHAWMSTALRTVRRTDGAKHTCTYTHGNRVTNTQLLHCSGAHLQSKVSIWSLAVNSISLIYISANLNGRQQREGGWRKRKEINSSETTNSAGLSCFSWMVTLIRVSFLYNCQTLPSNTPHRSSVRHTWLFKV